MINHNVGRNHLFIPKTLSLGWLKHNMPGICSTSVACNDPTGISRGLVNTTISVHCVRFIKCFRYLACGCSSVANIPSILITGLDLDSY